MSKIGSKYRTPPNHLRQIQNLNKNYVIEKVIGTGKFGIVCNATMGTGDKKMEIAVKIINLKKTSEEYKTKLLPKELHHLEILDHKYIVKIFDIQFIENTFYIFMEKAFGGDLLDMLNELHFRKGIPEPRTKYLYRMIAIAVKYIHDRGSAHRDIKCENVLLINRERTIAKLTDFGSSTNCFEPKTHEKTLRNTYTGTPDYVAPEVLRKQPYDAMKADVWSLGVVLYVMLQNELPYNRAEVSKMAFQQKRFKLEFAGKYLSEDVKDLVTKQLEIDPLRRLTMTDVVEHKWFR